MKTVSADERTGSGFSAFFASLWSSWVARISGPASALLLILAFFVPDRIKFLTSIAAVLCLLVAAYEVWRIERIPAATAELRLKPAFRFDLDHPSCVMPEGKTLYYRVALWNTGADAIDDVVVEICSADPSPTEWESRYPIPLSIMHAEPGTTLVLRNGQPALVDIFVFTPGGRDILVMHSLPSKVGVYVPARTFHVVLQAAGRGVIAHSRTFLVDMAGTTPKIKAA